MFLKCLRVHQLRNLTNFELQDLQKINLIHGENGSGKTSVLEAIYMLSSTRPFRRSQYRPAIQIGKKNLNIFGEIESNQKSASFPIFFGLSRSREGKCEIRLNKKLITIAQAIRQVPVQVIHSQTFSLLDDVSQVRRQFMDWGVFHVEHSFYSQWQKAQRALRQRNILLREPYRGRGDLDFWSEQLIRYGEMVDNFRTHWFSNFIVSFQIFIKKLFNANASKLSLDYYRGWDERPLGECLAGHLEADRRRGYTWFGPQRADLRLYWDGHLAAPLLSRGQQKLAIIAMRLAQGALLAERTGKHSLFLMDDLPAELDAHHRRILCGLLPTLSHQFFITCNIPDELAKNWTQETPKEFHIAAGSLRRKKTA